MLEAADLGLLLVEQLLHGRRLGTFVDARRRRSRRSFRGRSLGSVVRACFSSGILGCLVRVGVGSWGIGDLVRVGSGGIGDLVRAGVGSGGIGDLVRAGSGGIGDLVRAGVGSGYVRNGLRGRHSVRVHAVLHALDRLSGTVEHLVGTAKGRGSARADGGIGTRLRRCVLLGRGCTLGCFHGVRLDLG